MEDEKKNIHGLLEKLHFGKWKKDQILILFLAGVLLLVIAIPTKDRQTEDQGTGERQTETDTAGTTAEGDYTRYLEEHLSEVLSQMEGAGEVTVMITLASSAEKVVEKDVEAGEETVTESDSQGGTRTTRNSTSTEASVYTGNDTEGQKPYVSKEITPQVEGVVVLAQGGDNSVVARNITEAVQALFGIDTHKIRIMKKN